MCKVSPTALVPRGKRTAASPAVRRHGHCHLEIMQHWKNSFVIALKYQWFPIHQARSCRGDKLRGYTKITPPTCSRSNAVTTHKQIKPARNICIFYGRWCQSRGDARDAGLPWKFRAPCPKKGGFKQTQSLKNHGVRWCKFVNFFSGLLLDLILGLL